MRSRTVRLLGRLGVEGRTFHDHDVGSRAPTEWVAVYDVSPYSEEDRKQFVEAAGPNVFEGSVRCFGGLVERLGLNDEDDVMVLALVANSEGGVRSAGRRVSGTPRLIGEFPSSCTD